MPDPLATVILSLLTLLALSASIIAAGRLRRRDAPPHLRKIQYSLTGICLLGAIGLVVYRAVSRGDTWLPLGSHLDGLLLIAVLFSLTFLFVQRALVRGLTAFALPLLTVMLAWAVCASAWTYEPFVIQSLWRGVHLGSVYLGSLALCTAAAAGAMYLYVQRRLHRHRGPAGVQRLASLEGIERFNISSATIGFALLTLALVTGLIIVLNRDQTRLGEQWWSSPKVLLAAAVWLIYAIVMNVRYATAFRGARAAWLSIAGVVLLVAVFTAAHDLPDVPPGMGIEQTGAAP